MGLEAVRNWIRHIAPPVDPKTSEIFTTSSNAKLSRVGLIAWIRWKEAAAARRENRRFRLTFIFVVIGALAAVMAAVEGWLSMQ
jgi:hypothetical protein